MQFRLMLAICYGFQIDVRQNKQRCYAVFTGKISSIVSLVLRKEIDPICWWDEAKDIRSEKDQVEHDYVDDTYFKISPADIESLLAN